MNFSVVSPATTEELFRVIADHQAGNYRFGAGYTDLILELKKQPDEDLTVINLARLRDERYTTIRQTDDTIRIGALVTAADIASSRILNDNPRYAVLCKAAENLASRQIRQVATVGGNLCTASPAGDISCGLMALEAQCEIASARGDTRTVPLREFFTGVRTTVLRRDEILQSVFVASGRSDTTFYSDFIKVGTRRSMECSVVSLGYQFQTDAQGTVIHAGIAVGSAAPTIVFAESACRFLIGKGYMSLNSDEADEFALKMLDHASPISDVRASAWYRTHALQNISRSIVGPAR